jgi:hypothetical protein
MYLRPSLRAEPNGDLVDDPVKPIEGPSDDVARRDSDNTLSKLTIGK